ncbi:MAG: T9SS type A sorting domain-containing protein [Bacteroidota bacterium]
MKSLNIYLHLLLAALLLFGFTVIHAQEECTPDVTAPVAICDADLHVTAVEGAGALIWNYDIDEGSFDLCSNVDLFLTRLEDDTGMAPNTSSVLLPDELGTYQVVLYVVDEAGNENNCWTDITVTDVATGPCATDEEPPAIICINGLAISLIPETNSATVWANDFQAVPTTDNCSENPTITINLLSESTGAPQGAPSLTFYTPGTYEVEIWAIDDFGNFTSCETYILVQQIAGCDDDTTPPVPICLSQLQVSRFAGTDVVLTGEDFDAGTYDNCGSFEFRLVLASESDGSLPSATSITLPSQTGTYVVEVWAVDDSGNANFCVTSVTFANIYYSVFGQVFQDENDNCALDDGEEDSGFGGWQVRATDVETGISEMVSTDADGGYNLILSLPTDEARNIEVELLLPDGVSTGCPTNLLLEDYYQPTGTVDFAMGLAEDCEYLTVDLATPFLRRCFPNTIFIQYNNFSATDTENVTVTVELDDYLAIQSASLPYSALGDNQYLFDIGTVPAASSGQFVIEALLSCEAELGQTHCLNASIEPFTCTTEDDFAELIISGECDELGDEVRFTVRNAGTVNMTQAQEVRIVEDVIMYMNGNPLQLDAGSEEQFTYPANGATWRLEIPQDASYPYGGIAAAFVEGCGGFTPGMATQFSLSSTNPNEDQLCLENIGAYDPNDKQALPKGYGEAHYIEANTPLEYLIRFQNTGTDTAFNIRIEDQISEYLDPSSIRPGAASHPYRMELKEDGLLIFHFDNIMLPDSNVNLAGSNGFVQFSIEQLPDNPINTIIENTAGIYFDFNDPIITNTVWHTIGEDFIMVQSYEVLRPDLQLTIAPNPVQTRTHIRLESETVFDGSFQIYDAQGRLLQQIPMQHNELWIERSQLPHDGLFLFRISSEGVVLAQGKLIAQ